MPRGPGLVFLDRARYEPRGWVAHLDADTASRAEWAIDSSKIPDGLPVITVGDTVFEPAWELAALGPRSEPAAGAGLLPTGAAAVGTGVPVIQNVVPDSPGRWLEMRGL